MHVDELARAPHNEPALEDSSKAVGGEVHPEVHPEVGGQNQHQGDDDVLGRVAEIRLLVPIVQNDHQKVAPDIRAGHSS